MSTSGIRRNQSRWHTLKLSCIARIAKTDGALGNTILACLLILLADIICMFVTESYLACVAVNTLTVVVWAAARRAHYQVVLPAALALASICLLARLYNDGFLPWFILWTANFMIALRPDVFRHWRYPKASLPTVAVISCVALAILLPHLPKDMYESNEHNWISEGMMFAIIGYFSRVIGKQMHDRTHGHEKEAGEADSIGA
ncbi:MAG: hypothetical protein ACYC1M_13480 [Armatimonadota bacterium]